MALMFPRLARNFAKNGYYPTDEPTLERALNALMPSDGPMCILDPCAGDRGEGESCNQEFSQCNLNHYHRSLTRA